MCLISSSIHFVELNDIDIPYFQEVIVMASTCDSCGYRNSEVFADLLCAILSLRAVIIIVLHHAVETRWKNSRKRKKDYSLREKC